MPEISPVLLQSFVVMAEELSFSRAANRLYVAQPALSQRIARLEDLTGLKLFERTTRRVEMTSQGAALLHEAQRFLEANQLFQDRLSALLKGKFQHLRVGYTPSTGYEITPRLAARFSHEHPSVEVQAKESWFDELVAEIRQGTVEVGVTRSMPHLPDIAGELIRRERLVVVMDGANPLAQRASIRLSELADSLFMFFPEQLASEYHRTLVELCRAAGFEPRVIDNPLPGVRSFDMLKEVGAVALRPVSTRLMHPKGIAFADVADEGAIVESYTLWSAVRKFNTEVVQQWLANARSVSDHNLWLEP